MRRHQLGHRIIPVVPQRIGMHRAACCARQLLAQRDHHGAGGVTLGYLLAG